MFVRVDLMKTLSLIVRSQESSGHRIMLLASSITGSEAVTRINGGWAFAKAIELDKSMITNMLKKLLGIYIDQCNIQPQIAC